MRNHELVITNFYTKFSLLYSKIPSLFCSSSLIKDNLLFHEHISVIIIPSFLYFRGTYSNLLKATCVIRHLPRILILNKEIMKRTRLRKDYYGNFNPKKILEILLCHFYS